MPKTYEPIATTTLSVSASEILFTSITGTYTDLILVGNFTLTASALDVRLQVGNGSTDTGSNYSGTYLTGDGSTAASSRNSNATFVSGYRQVGGGAGWQTLIYHFQNYSNTTTNKTVLTRLNDAGAEVVAGVGLWRSTSAIDRIRLFTSANAFNAPSNFTLYGIKAA